MEKQIYVLLENTLQFLASKDEHAHSLQPSNTTILLLGIELRADQHSITWELARHANSQTPPQIY